MEEEVTKEKFCKLIGSFKLGNQPVKLYISPISGGTFNIAPNDGSEPFIEVGTIEGQADWEEVMTFLIHECHEFVMTKNYNRYLSHPSTGCGHSDYLFSMTHHQFSIVCGSVAQFMSECLMPLWRAFQEVNDLKH